MAQTEGLVAQGDVTPPDQLLELVDRFGRFCDAYRSGRYKEAQVRQEFIDPLFGLLGWDVENRTGQSETYKDVVHEDAIQVGGGTKAPDYSFRIGGVRRYFVEAKKPSVNVRDDVAPAYQLRRYAWSAKLPLSILTDFEELAVYDTCVRPDKDDNPSKARLKFMEYTEYPERWAEIASVFSKEAVLSGSLEEYACKTEGRRGTDTVNAAFLREIEGWREALARNLALRNPHLTQRQLNYAVQMTIDRIIFLRMAEDRGIEEYGRLLRLANGSDIYAGLKEMFLRADERYNSGLFHFEKEKDRPYPDDLTLSLDIDDAVLQGVVRKIYYPDSPYEFSVLPLDVLGQVYEQFLGKVIRLSPDDRKVEVEEKPEVRKAGGVYYTPTYIVDYIVKNTVGKLLEGKKAGPRGSASRLRIVDPACGSGSFLIGAYTYLLDWHRDQYVAAAPAQHRRELYQGAGGTWHLTTQEKKRILLNNIYGVDIDPQAVEVTKLSLLLKVLEGESEQSLVTQLSMFHERALPDLDDNIKCGNSLMGPEFYHTVQMSFLDEEEHYRLNVFDWTAAFPQVFSGAKPRFDVVIGNPPYGAYLYELEKPYLLSKYPHQSYQLDSYLLFLERAVTDLLSQGGLYGMIIPNPWLTNLLQNRIRRFVLNSTHIHEIVHFQFPVFPKVTVDTEIVILQKEPAEAGELVTTIVDSLATFLAPARHSKLRQIRHEQRKWLSLDGGVINIFISPMEERLAAKCFKAGIPLSSLYAINVGIKPYQAGKGIPPQTKETVRARPFDSDKPIDSSYRAYLRGSDIGRYRIQPLQARYIKYGSWLAEPRPSANFDAPLKIVMRQTGDSLVAAVDSEKYLCLNNMHVLVPLGECPSPFYVLGIINSRLLNWYYHTLNPEVGEALAEVKKTNVARLPIRNIVMSDPTDRTYHDQMVQMVERMLSLHERLASARTGHDKTIIQRQIDATDRQIDRLVYELYGLTDEEIRTVEAR